MIRGLAVVMMCVMQSLLISWVGVHSRPINVFRNVRFTWIFQAHPSFANTYHCFDHRMTFHQMLANRPIKSRISGLPRPFSVNYLHMLSKQYNHTSVVFPLLMFYVACRAPVALSLKGFCGNCSTSAFLVTALTNGCFLKFCVSPLMLH